MNKRQAYKLLKNTYTEQKHIRPLCESMPAPLKKKWKKVWIKINKDRNKYMNGYLSVERTLTEEPAELNDMMYILRVLTACIFVKDNY